MNLRLSWKDPRLLFPSDQKEADKGLNSTNSLESFNDIITSTTIKPVAPKPKKLSRIAVSTEILNNIWVPDPFFRKMRDFRQFKVMQDVQGIFLYSDKTVYTSTLYVYGFRCYR